MDGLPVSELVLRSCPNSKTDGCLMINFLANVQCVGISCHELMKHQCKDCSGASWMSAPFAGWVVVVPIVRTHLFPRIEFLGIQRNAFLEVIIKSRKQKWRYIVSNIQLSWLRAGSASGVSSNKIKNSHRWKMN